jgi:hypothetical protein
MPDVQRPHQEPFARVRSALGAAGQQEARGLAALRDIEEQYQELDEAHVYLMKRLAGLEEQFDASEKYAAEGADSDRPKRGKGANKDFVG